jgi:hypothetical protein
MKSLLLTENLIFKNIIKRMVSSHGKHILLGPGVYSNSTGNGTIYINAMQQLQGT